MSERGVFAVDRGIWDHDLLADSEPFSRREAWLWLVSEAAWKPHRRRIIGRPIDLQRGQLVASTRFIASKWRWSEARVRRFLNALISEAMIVAKTDAGVNVVTICKYDEYQRVSLPSDAMRETDGDAGATQERRKVEGKEYKEVDSDADASAQPPARDVRKELFSQGREALERITGRTPDACRRLLGKWLKSVNEDAVAVKGAIEDAERNRIADPVPWIERVLHPKTKEGRKYSVIDAADRLVDTMRQWETPDEPDLLENLRGGAGPSDVRLLPPNRSG